MHKYGRYGAVCYAGMCEMRRNQQEGLRYSIRGVR